MLPDAERLRRASVFKRVYAARKSVSTAIATLYVLPKSGQNRIQNQFQGGEKVSERPGLLAKQSGKLPGKPPLVGFVVAKKVSKSACARNKAKRRVREAYRLIRKSCAVKDTYGTEAPQLFLDQWYALVFVIHEKVLTATWEEIEKSVAACLANATLRYGRGR